MRRYTTAKPRPPGDWETALVNRGFALRSFCTQCGERRAIRMSDACWTCNANGRKSRWIIARKCRIGGSWVRPKHGWVDRDGRLVTLEMLNEPQPKRSKGWRES